MITDFIIVATIMTVVTDYIKFPSTIIDIVANWLGVKTRKTIKPLECSLCQTFWICLIICLVNGELSLYNVLLCLFSGVLTKYILAGIYLIDSILVYCFEKI